VIPGPQLKGKGWGKGREGGQEKTWKGMERAVTEGKGLPWTRPSLGGN